MLEGLDEPWKEGVTQRSESCRAGAQDPSFSAKLLGALPPLPKWSPVLLELRLPGAFAGATARNTTRSRSRWEMMSLAFQSSISVSCQTQPEASWQGHLTNVVCRLLAPQGSAEYGKVHVGLTQTTDQP